jgi:hypothetical protein
MQITEAIEERLKQIRLLQQEINALEKAAEILKGTPKTDKPRSQPDMAAAILEGIGKPMHIAQIAAQIKREFGATIKANNLGVMLFRYSKRGSRFYKVQGKPSTYGLVKWQDISERIESAKTHGVDAMVS